MAKAQTNADLAREMVRRFPDAPSQQLARKLYKKHPERYTTPEAAHQSVRYVRGNKGEKLRKCASGNDTRRENGKPGWKPECPPSSAEAWLPFVLDTPCRVLSLSDTHVPYHEPKAIEAAVEYARKKFKPDVVLLNGDIADFYQVSRWEKDPSRCNGMRNELGIVEDFLRWLRGIFPKARMIYKLGNHEERWDKYIWLKAPEVWDLAPCRVWDLLHLESMGIESVSEQRPVMAGSLPIFHGHELGKGISSPVNPARGAFLRTLDSVLVGHHHRTSSHTESSMWHNETATWSQGCLCNMRPEYSRVSNKWNWGFATVEAVQGGSFNVRNYRMNGDYEVRTS
jgi:predicted phosphodiesterase